MSLKMTAAGAAIAAQGRVILTSGDFVYAATEKLSNGSLTTNKM
jgi:hypothetical protein